ncbi:non-ribosomal peptide synthetase [Paenibacillus sp. FSL R7-0337]|uniref:non-ribosomal peptide synthetase n=1 Tax=Paenibacillus sp. FSL R7-0337 TaxID=1926588 RepID=UPI00096EE560|nr:non-ribosomal peptide synthetase [Paenibacillus sp. FSL R7-0337]OMF98434.1 hypothetical protein BK147_09300 [Paenibacillus sp. FSL R7-0337]
MKSSIQGIGSATGAHETEKEYWLNTFSGDFTKSHFPYDHKVLKSTGSQRNIEVLKFTLPQEISARLLAISNHSDVRMFITLTTALIILLDKYTGNKDITVGIPIYKQSVEGEYLNTVLPIRNCICDDLTFKQTLLDVSRSIREANENQNYPIHSLIYNLQLTGDDEFFPLFDAVVLLQNIHNRADILHTRPNITFSFNQTGDTLQGEWEYNTLLYHRSTIEAIRKHFTKLLAETLFNIEITLGKIDILSNEEKEWLIHEVNATSAEYPLNCTIHGWFEQQVDKTPEHSAVVCENQTLTYRDLNRRANQIAHILREHGVGSDTVVPVLFNRSMDMIVGLLAVLKAGGAYLPIDPELPYERMSFMVRESGSPIVLSNTATLQSCRINSFSGQHEEIPALLVDELQREHSSLNSSNPDSHTSADGLAYVMYTSGSTGEPKGVMLEHRSVVNVLNWFGKTAKLGEGTRVLLTYEYTSDPSVEDIFATLLFGATLYITDKYSVIDRELFRRFVDEHNINILNYVPRLIQELLCRGPKLESLHTVLSGGEPLEDHVKDELLNKGYIVYNDYGPTEASIDCLSQRCSDGNISIGRPIDNMSCLVLDANNRIQPVGVSGELYISGVGLARGYLNRPELTAQRFINHPYAANQRIYKTGDLARVLSNGEVEFLGRLDQQVKIRGYRVELGEIEHQIMKNGQVKEALVLATKDHLGEKRIAAYIVPGAGLSLSDLQWNLTQTLPDYMLPTYWIPIEHIPLTTTGKVDTKALPQPQKAYSENSARIHPPETETEKVIEKIWSEVLDKEAIDIQSNFFEIGGHSLSIITVKNKIRNILGKDLAMVTLFQYCTIHALARYLDNHESELTESGVTTSLETMDETLQIIRGLSHE